ncbi:MAG: DUF4350 domain-containing protein [Novosphingobium sp.]
MRGSRGSPFSPRVALALVLGGALAFVALLWAVGSGMADPEPQPSGAHVEGKGLAGYAALSDYLKARGFDVSETRTRGKLQQGGLLVLTPLHQTKADALNRAIRDHRQFGPTLLIMPKWLAMPLPAEAGALNPKIKPGFVQLIGPAAPKWEGFHDEVAVDLSPLAKADDKNWSGFDQSGPVANPDAVVSARGRSLVPLVSAGRGGRTIVAYFDDGDFPDLAAKALAPPSERNDTAGGDEAPTEDAAPAVIDPAGDAPADEVDPDAAAPDNALDGAPDVPIVVAAAGARQRYPVIVVFDPDFLNNFGLAHQENAFAAEELVRLALRGDSKQIVFDLTLAGYGRSESLLELAFTPPFLAATLCLLLAAAIALWRAYHRFGPPLIAARSIAFGKRALVGNAAGLLRRAKRLHLVGAPYTDAVRERLVKALALPPRLDRQAAEAAIDRALLARTGTSDAFSTASAALREASRPREMLRAAQTLNSLERTLLQ